MINYCYHEAWIFQAANIWSFDLIFVGRWKKYSKFIIRGFNRLETIWATIPVVPYEIADHGIINVDIERD